MVQAAAPEAKVVKAFNTVNWQMMISPEDSNGPISVPLAGNDRGKEGATAFPCGRCSGLAGTCSLASLPGGRSRRPPDSHRLPTTCPQGCP